MGPCNEQVGRVLTTTLSSPEAAERIVVRRLSGHGESMTMTPFDYLSHL